jgi:PAS domain-containing protein
MRSELCLPLKFGEVPWLLNIEDDQLNAFSTEEEKAVIRVMGEVCEFLEKSWLSHFLEASLATTTDAIIVSDGTARVTQANPAAVDMFDLKVIQRLRTETNEAPASQSQAIVRTEPKPIRALFVNPVEADNIIKNRRAPKTAIMTKRPSGGTRPVLLSMVDLQEDFGYTIFGAADLTVEKRLEEIENLGEIYLEIATQTKTPLSLACGWLNRLKRQMTEAEERDTLDKVIRQLRKLEITYDRLALYAEDQKAIPFNPCLLDIAEVLDDVHDDMPASESDKINWQYPKGELLVVGDLFQLRFCFETILAHLLRFVPEDNKIDLTAVRKDRRVVTTINGWHPQKHWVSVETEREKQTDLAKALVDMAFGEIVIQKFIDNHKGFYRPPVQSGETITFELTLDFAED